MANVQRKTAERSFHDFAESSETQTSIIIVASSRKNSIVASPAGNWKEVFDCINPESSPVADLRYTTAAASTKPKAAAKIPDKIKTGFEI